MKTIYVHLVLVASCFLFVSCQPPTNDLMPIEQDGALVVSTKKKKDNALQYDNESFSLKVYGNWRVSYKETSLFVVIKNRSETKIQVDFTKVIFGNSLNEHPKLTAVEVVTETLGTVYKTGEIENKIAKIGSGELRIFIIDIHDNESKIVEETYGNTIWFTIPVDVENNKIFSTTNYNFKFKYDHAQPEVDHNDTLIE
jgi:hypothetical protein